MQWRTRRGACPHKVNCPIGAREGGLGHAPTVLRGQLTQLPEDYVRAGRKITEAVVLGNTLLNVAARPQFIAHRIGPKSACVRFAEKMGTMPVGWTSHSRDSEAGRDAVIFEYYKPGIRYK